MSNFLLASSVYTDCANDGIASWRTAGFEAFHTLPDMVTQAVSQWRLPSARASAKQMAIKHDHKLKRLTIIPFPVNK
jgi:hypothetical protein